MSVAIDLSTPAQRAARATGIRSFTLEEVLAVEPGEARRRLRAAGYYPQYITSDNYKLAKEVAGEEIEIAGVALLPHAMSGVGKTLCAYSVPSCRATCLATGAGWNAARPVATIKPRLARSWALARDPVAFAAVLLHEVGVWSRRLRAAGISPALRLNVYSDIPWEVVAPDWVVALARLAHLYDYTKIPGRRARAAALNYDLTLSWSGHQGRIAAHRQLLEGGRVAVVFMTPGRPSSAHQAPLPSSLDGWPVIDGDRHDARFLEGAGIVGLRFKQQSERSSKAADVAGFVLHGPWSDWGYEPDAETGLLRCGSPCSTRGLCSCWPVGAAL